MNILVTQELQNLEGTGPIKGLDPDVVPEVGETTVAYTQRASIDLTFRRVAVEALLAKKEKDSGTLKMQKFVLAQRIQLHTSVTLSNEELKILQDACDSRCSVLVTGRMTEILDPVGYRRHLGEPVLKE